MSDGWSDSLKTQTRKVIGDSGLGVSPDGQLHLKHATREFGAISADDLRDGVLRVTNLRTDEVVTFSGVDELIDAGWVVD